MTEPDYQLVLLVGAARSGTTLLAEQILAHHPQVAYWSEPDHVWNYGNLYRQNDSRGASEATEDVKRHIRSSFESQWRKQGRKPVLLEKTPANCLRIPFIREVFPGAKLIHLVRDGRDVALSASVEWQGGKNVQEQDGSWWKGVSDGLRVIWEQIMLRDMLSTLRLKQLPYYAWRALQLIRMRVLGLGATWGPKVPGLRDLLNERSLIEVCAIQWRECVDRALAGLPAGDSDLMMELRYEELLDAPRREVCRTLEFMGLGLHEEVEVQLDRVRSGNQRKWESKMSDDEYEAVMKEIRPTLERLGYPVGD